MDPKVRRFVAGKKITDAISHAQKINRLKIHALIDHVGENIKVKKHCKDYTNSYIDTINRISRKKLNASVSLKLTQIGLAINRKFCEQNLNKILKNASKNNVFVWVDMEEHKYMKKTLSIYNKFLKKHKIGITIQANIRGTGKIVEGLITQKARIRIVKGIYREKQDIAFQTTYEIDMNFSKLMNLLSQKSNNFAIATHDFKIIKIAEKINNNFEFQMLMGVRPAFEKHLVKLGFIVAEYVPYGMQWEEYYKRRIKEINLHRLE